MTRTVGKPLLIRCLVATTIFTVLSAGAFAGADAKPNNKANWKLANRYSNEFLRQYTYSAGMTPQFINRTDEFWYSWRDMSGVKFYRVDPKGRKKSLLFDSAKMAAQLSELSKKPYDTTNLPITTLTFTEKAEAIRFVVDNIQYEYNLETETLKSLGRAPRGGGGPGGGGGGGGQGGGGGGGGFGGGFGQGGQNRDFRNYSPDRKHFVYAMDHNLYYVEVGKEDAPVQLTKDGAEDFSFGSIDAVRRQQQQLQQIQQQQQQQQDDDNQDNNQNQGGANRPDPNEKRVRANVTWSKDSKKFYVTRSDSRKVKELFLVNSLSEPRPTLLSYKYTMPGETDVTQFEMFAFDTEKKELKRLPLDKYKDQQFYNVHWKDDSSKLRVVRRDRLQRNLEFLEIDPITLEQKLLIPESVENAFLERQNVRYLKPDGDMIWFSERSGWGHFYLYGPDGKLKNQITSGPFRAEQIVDVDADKGIMWFRGVGRESGENPYYRHLYRVNLDGSGLTLLDPGDADHTATPSPSKKFVVDVCSRTDMAPIVLVKNDKGETVMELEKTDTSRLAEIGWKMPEVFKVKAADGTTDIYGNMWKPFDFDKNKKYPIIANVYPGPQTESVTAAFSATATNQRLANLGFIVVQIGNRGGNPSRSNAYHSYGYYNLRDYGLADKKAGIEQLAARNEWIDIDKVGIFGHSGGGFMTAAALLLPPYNDFFKVGVSSSGNHDNNVYNQNWSEQHHGLREVPVNAAGGNARGGTGAGRPPETSEEALADPDWLLSQVEPWAYQGGGQQGGTGETKFEIKVPTNHELAPNLKGSLLLVHGDMDNNVHPAGTIRLVNALIKANKRFDLMIMPGQAHGYGTMQPYFTQMMMEYFAEHLLGDYYRGSADINDKGG